MLFLFCSDPLNQTTPDLDYEAEAAAARRHGSEYALIDFEALVSEGDGEKAVRRVPHQAEPAVGIYRGWMMKPGHYAQLYAALADRGITMLNSP